MDTFRPERRVDLFAGKLNSKQVVASLYRLGLPETCKRAFPRAQEAGAKGRQATTSLSSVEIRLETRADSVGSSLGANSL